MKRVEEVMYIVPSQREAFIDRITNPSLETQQVYWIHGLRNLTYFRLNNYILMTFDYVGKDFKKDLDEVSAYLNNLGLLVSKRRRDVRPDRLLEENWWAPIKKIGNFLTENPMPSNEVEEEGLEGFYHEMISGFMKKEPVHSDTAYDDDDWSESIHL